MPVIKPQIEQDDVAQPAESIEDQVFRIKTFPKDTHGKVIEAKIGITGIRKQVHEFS